MAVRTERLAGECPHVALTPTQQGILAGIRNGNETEVPALLASKVEFLVSRDIAALMKKLDAQCADEGERTELTALFNVVIDFVEQFVGNTAALAEANGQLLREILEAAAAGMQALDTKMDAMLAGQDPRYTPEFIRFLDAEMTRLRGAFRTPHLRPRARARAEKITTVAVCHVAGEVQREQDASARDKAGGTASIDVDAPTPIGGREEGEEEHGHAHEHDHEHDHEHAREQPDAAAALHTLAVSSPSGLGFRV